MKRIVLGIIVYTMALAMCACGGKKEGTKEKETLTVFNMSEYLDPEVLTIFEEETGIKVEYEEATTPEEMYSKYISGAIKYDLLCTTDFMIDRLIEENELQKVDFSTFEYAQNIGGQYWDIAKAYDENNEYALPYFWGTLGILYNTKKVDKPVDSWEVLFNGDYSGQIIMQNSMRELYMVALKYLGYSVNTTKPEEIKAAHDLLMKQKPDVQAYLVDEARDEVVAGNAVMAVIYSGEAYLGHQYNEDLAYVVPNEGSNVWIDNWVVTKNCDNMDNAKKFLDFLCREDIAEMNFEYIYYSTPNDAVVENMEDELKNDPAIVPPESDIDKCEVSVTVDKDTLDLYNKLWKELKSE